MSTWGNRTRSAAWLIPLLVTALALALPAAGEAAGTGAISGTVTAEGGGAAEGVDVCAEMVTEEDWGCHATAADGTYEIVGLQPGEYKVEFWASDQNLIRQFYDDKDSLSTATPVFVTDGTTAPGINAVMAKGAKISGRVTAAATGLPVEEVEVCALSTNETSFGCAYTNSSGNYSIGGLAGGQYEVFFFTYETGQDLVSEEYPLGLVTLAAGGEVNNVNVALQKGGQIAGTVRVAATNAPLANVKVCITEASSNWALGCLTTPQSGGYRFAGIWSGSFKVVFSPEASELEEGENWELSADGFPTQWWQGQPNFADATPIAITPPAVVTGIDGSLGPPPVVAPKPVPAQTAPAITIPVPKPKPLRCRHGRVKRKVKGMLRCVKRHRPARHHHRKAPKPHSA